MDDGTLAASKAAGGSTKGQSPAATCAKGATPPGRTATENEKNAPGAEDALGFGKDRSMTRATARHLNSWASPPSPNAGEMGGRPSSIGQPNRGWGHRFRPQRGVPRSRDTRGDEHRDRHRDKHRIAAWVAALPRHTERVSITKLRRWLGDQFSEVWRRWSALPPVNSSPRATERPEVISKYPGAAMGRRRDPGDLKAEVVEVGGCPLGCPRFKERIKWAFL